MKKSVGVNLGIVLASAFFAGCGSESGAEGEEKAEATPTQKESIAAIEKLGGMFVVEGKILSFKNSEVTDDGLVHLKGLSGLHTLWLNDTNVTDAGLVHLKGLGRLELLSLGTKVTDAGLENLAGLTGLNSLNFYGSNVTDAGLVHLKGLSGLKSLTLEDTKVTDAGVAKLQAALPNCEITH